MPWMLLSEAEPEPATVRLDRQAWILVGGLERSLCQAGMLEALLRNGQRPQLIYAGGIATVNAIFSGRGRSSDIRRGWEQLRTARFLPAAALGAGRAAVFSRTPQTRALAALRAVLASAPPAALAKRLLLLTATGLTAAAVDANGAGVLADFLSPQLLAAEATPANLASAITDAHARGTTRIVIFAVDQDELGDDNQLRSAIDSTRRGGVEVCFLSATSRARPGLLHYLLPGLGGIERLTALGREAGLVFLGQNGRRRPL